MTSIHLKNPRVIAAAAAALLWTAGVSAYGALHEDWNMFQYFVAPLVFLSVFALLAAMAVACCGLLWLLLMLFLEMAGEFKSDSERRRRKGGDGPGDPHGGSAPGKPWLPFMRRQGFRVVDGGAE